MIVQRNFCNRPNFWHPPLSPQPHPPPMASPVPPPPPYYCSPSPPHPHPMQPQPQPPPPPLGHGPHPYFYRQRHYNSPRMGKRWNTPPHNFNCRFENGYPRIPREYHSHGYGPRMETNYHEHEGVTVRHFQTIPIKKINETAGINNKDSGFIEDFGEDASLSSAEEFPSEEEEYQPEYPEIRGAVHLRNFNLNHFELEATNSTTAPITPAPWSSPDTLLPEFQDQMTSCDEQGFHEACVAVWISSYPESIGRMFQVAGFGVWFSEDSASNFSGVLESHRPQNVKAAMIHGSATTIGFLKNKGYTRIRVNLESDYLNNYVLGWISKYMTNAKAPASNWDELKYHTEILNLCAAASGMVIKWSHCTETSTKKEGLMKAKRLAKKATDDWLKSVQTERAEGDSSPLGRHAN